MRKTLPKTIKGSLKTSLLYWFLLISLLPLFIFTYLGYTNMKSSLEKSATTTLAQSSKNKSDFINSWFKFRVIDISSWSDNQSSKEFLKVLSADFETHAKDTFSYIKSYRYQLHISEYESDIVRLKRKYRYVYDAFLLDTKGNILYTVVKEDDLGTNLVDGKYSQTKFAQTYSKTMKDGKIHFSDLELYGPSDNIVAGFFTSPVIDENGELLGVFAIQIKLNNIVDIFKQENKTEKSYSHYLVGEDSYLRSDLNEDYKSLKSKIQSEQFLSWKKHHDSSEDTLRYKGPLGGNVIGMHQNINILDTQWTLISEVDEAIIFEEIDVFLNEMVMLALLIVMIVILLSIFISNKIVKPLENLVRASIGFIAGKEDIIVRTKAKGEIGELTNSFNQMTSSLVKAKQEAQESAVAKSEFLASMSHEIRTPLNAILGFVGVLNKRIDDEASKKYLSIINSSGNSLLTIINDILDFSKMQSGKFEIDKHEVLVMKEFTNTILLFNAKIQAKQLRYLVYIDPKLPKSLLVDITRINQILSNLLSNAIKFTPMYGFVEVSIAYENKILCISVKDSGIGIEKENLSKVFSAFSQADSSTTRKYGGTGLGLSISSTLASLMGGTLVAKSEVGKGSEFILKLKSTAVSKDPIEFIDTSVITSKKIAILNNWSECTPTVELIKKYLKDLGVTDIITLDSYQEEDYDILFFVPSDDYNDEIVEARIPSIAILNDTTVQLATLEHLIPMYSPFIPDILLEALSKVMTENLIAHEEIDIVEEDISFEGHVLVAEDNVTNQMLIKLLLSDYGITFEIANDGVEAVDLFKEKTFDLVLMDENMPNKNGIEAMREIKAYEKEKSLEATGIVALTANALETDKKRFQEAGMNGFIAKPIDNQELELVLAKYLG